MNDDRPASLGASRVRAAARLDGLRPSVIREMTRLALGHQAVNLAQGFPDFPPPPEIIAAAHAALDRGDNQYTVTWGIPPLRAAIARTMQPGLELVTSGTPTFPLALAYEPWRALRTDRHLYVRRFGERRRPVHLTCESHQSGARRCRGPSSRSLSLPPRSEHSHQ